MTTAPQDPKSLPTQADLDEALQGTDMGSDTRAGSLRGGSASGSDIDPDQKAINAALAQQGTNLHAKDTKSAGGPDQAKPDEKQPGDDVDTVTD